jgi:hypothetical protein
MTGWAWLFGQGDLRVLELQAAKEILAEIFDVRI